MISIECEQMACIIHSKCKQVSKDLLSNISSTIKSSRECEHLPKSSPKPTAFFGNSFNMSLQDILSGDLFPDVNPLNVVGNGIIVKCDFEIYVLTCKHIIGDFNIETYAYCNTISGELMKVQLNILEIIPELDLTVLIFADKKQEKNVSAYMPTTKKFTDIEKRLDRIQVRQLEVKGFSPQKLVEKKTIVDNFSIKQTHIVSQFAPKFPVLNFSFPREQSDHLDEKGFSGNTVELDGDPIGIIVTFSKETRSFDAVPLHIVYHIINNITRHSDHFVPFVSTEQTMIQFTSKIVEIETDDENLICHCVTSFRNVGYPMKINNGKAVNSKREFKFKHNDIIMGINGIPFDKSGKIYDERYGFVMNLDSYIFLECKNRNVNGNIEMTYYRQIDGKHKKTTVVIESVKLSEIYEISFFANYDFFCFDNYLFFRLSEQMIMLLGLEKVKMWEYSKKISSGLAGIRIESPKQIFLVKQIGGLSVNSVEKLSDFKPRDFLSMEIENC